MPNIDTSQVDPESTVDGLGVSERQLSAYQDWAENQPALDREPEPDREAGQ